MPHRFMEHDNLIFSCFCAASAKLGFVVATGSVLSWQSFVVPGVFFLLSFVLGKLFDTFLKPQLRAWFFGDDYKFRPPKEK